MLCAISGEAPQEPVASKKSGNVFEKRLIEAYIAENGSDPVTGEELVVEDLVELKNARIVKPRPPTLTSIPSLLSVFQNEWDALALETYTLKQHLSSLRQELSTALYNNDAAVRAIARLTKERDEARDALAKVTIQERANASSRHRDSNGGDAMQVDAATTAATTTTTLLPQEILDTVDATHSKLSKTRKKRPVPADWTTPDAVGEFELQAPSKVNKAGSHALAVDADGEAALLGGADGTSSLYSLASHKQLQAIKGDGAEINAAIFWEQGVGDDDEDGKTAIIATASGEIRAIHGGKVVVTVPAHTGPATALSLHPSSSFFASVGTDKSIVFYQILSPTDVDVLSRIFTDSELSTCKFHPDGQLLAVAGASRAVKIYDVKTSQNVANFACDGAVTALDFSENGFWLAVAVQGSSAVSIWDLRKAEAVKTLETNDNAAAGAGIAALAWDYSGQYLAAAGGSVVSVQHYDKASKSWSRILSSDGAAATAMQWQPLARGLVLLAEGSLRLLA